MRTGTGNRTNYNRTTGSRTARLYSKRTAKNINRIYQQQNLEENRRRTVQNSRNNYDDYDDYYDRPQNTKKKTSKSKSTPVIIATMIVIVLAVVFVALALMKPQDHSRREIVEETTPVQEQTDTAEQQTAVPAVVEESDPPVIYGIIPIIVYEGHSVAYKQGIYVEDDTDPSPTLEVDNEYVDLSTPGTYIVSYIARDKDGNVTREATSVTVLEGANMVSDEDIYALADSVLANIVTEYMTDAEKCLRVYEYLHAIGYVDEVHSEDWMQNAYWMLSLREGDCFCYYSAARLLLTRLGYEVMEVQNNNNYTHYWCLVSTDNGTTWWHFDATQWVWGEDGILCLVSDNYLAEFTRRHKTGDGRLIHAWDRTNYPSTPEEDFWTDEDRSIIYEGEYLGYNPYAVQDPYAQYLPGYGYTENYYYNTDPAAGYNYNTDLYTGYGYDTEPYIGYGYDTDPTAAGYGYDTDLYTGYGYDTPAADGYDWQQPAGYGYDTTDPGAIYQLPDTATDLQDYTGIVTGY